MNIDLRYGDTIEQMKLIPDKSIDFICCDLPYGTTACAWDIIIPFDKLWEQYERIIKDGGNIALFGVGLFGSKLVCSNEKLFKYELIWNKEQGTNQFMKDYRPLCKHELIYLFFNEKYKNTYNPIMVGAWRREVKIRMETNNKITATESKIKTNYDNKGLKYPTSIIDVNREHWRNGRLHNTQKPLELIQWLVETYSNENDVVLDNTFGSCTTGIACINTNRNFIGIENNMDYFNISKKRVEEKRKEKEFNLITSFGDGM